MMLSNSPAAPDADLGVRMKAFIAELYPWCRSITGAGVRKTLNRIGCELPLQLTEIPSGTKVFDWTIPLEWNIRDAFLKDATGKRVVDYNESNLHVVSYSVPFHARIPIADLRPHLFSLPDRPDWIPYRTTYYRENWGFCLSHRQLETLSDPEYEACIDSSLEPGSLTYGECLIPGESADEVLVSCHVCHPSLCNDNLSGIAAALFFAKRLQQHVNRLSYRFLFIPGTIGSIAWLWQNRHRLDGIRHGFVMTCVGDDAPFTYKSSRRGDALVDRAFTHLLKHCSPAGTVQSFSPYGYDERQFCSPGFNLPVGCLMRSPHGTFPEYHTSGDNIDFVHGDRLADTVRLCLDVVEVLEHNAAYTNMSPFCEPQLGARGLYGSAGAGSPDALTMAMLWVLNQSDGASTLLDIAERAGIRFGDILLAAAKLAEHNLVQVRPATAAAAY